MYKAIRTDGGARRADFTTPHGVVELPAFMNVATSAAIKGALDSADLRRAGCQIALANAYHLHARPGDELVRALGGLHRFMAWDGPALTDSGGFQVFSLASLRKIREEGVTFSSHVDGRRIFMGPEESMVIQANLGADIAMAFDECPPSTADYGYMAASAARTERWLARCAAKRRELAEAGRLLNPGQVLFGINQGGVYHDLRREHARRISEYGLPGYAIGGLAVGESPEEMYAAIEAVVPELPADRPTYLMGVGTPENILEAVERGVNLFDCVLPARNGRHGHVYTNSGRLNLLNKRFERDDAPIEAGCGCLACERHTRAYIRHLFKAGELLAMRLCAAHNLWWFNELTREIRQAAAEGRFAEYKKRKLERLVRITD
ncbi:MAG: tRNA guanosine(34) transglycosylase Tgt [Clostridiales bacterium]|jgi:queuine tRNA-ribosyltransferase|nr:tRNA guanosine(34) transglycosylase Tgt [Clostridiales bacterium]